MTAEATRLKFICRLGYGDALPKDDDLPGDIPVFGSNGQYSFTAVRNTGIPAIVVGRKGSYGKINWAPEGCFASDTTFFIDSQLTNENLRWLYWVLQTLKLDEGSQEAAVPGLNRESVYEQRILRPKAEIQYQIANYLDREISRIDTLIAEKERMLALLDEKRTALITRAVTRGLDPDVRMKDSDLEWLNKIPVHWQALRIKQAFNTIGSGTTPSTNQDEFYRGNIPWVTTSELRENIIVSSEKMISDDALKQFSALKIYPVGSLLIAMYGATIGRTALLGLSATVNQAVCVLANGERFFEEYVFYTLQIIRDFLISFASGGGQPNLNAEKIREFKLPCPPMAEQRKIVTQIKQELGRFDEGFKEIKKSVLLLKERRTALITAAVTGYIDIKEMTV